MATAQGILWKGGPIIEPGIYSNMTLDHYHSAKVCRAPAISSSGLRRIFNESPAHYWCESPYNSKRIVEDTPRHFALGRAMHHLAMGQDAFDKEFAVTPEFTKDAQGRQVKWSLRTNHAKAWVEVCKARGLEWITRDEIESIRGMSASLAANGFVTGAGVLEGFVERSGFWRDEETNVWLKIRPDVIPSHRGGEMVDLKTCASVQWSDLLRAVENHGYDQQFALMREVLRKLKMPFTAAALVFVEKTPPYCVRVVELSDDDLDIGEAKNRTALRRFALCWNVDRWPGPAGERRDAETLRLTDAARARADSRLKSYREEEDNDRRAGADIRIR
jgi:PDDEXK-like domain of unknown function (DUF3799)